MLTLRPMKESDIESIIALDALLTGATPDRAGFWRGLLSVHLPPEEDASAPPTPMHLCHVAELNEKGRTRLAGFIIGDVQSWQFGLPRHGRIVTLGVNPDLRRHKVGTQLAESLMSVFRKMDLPFVHCLVQPGDPLGDFFVSCGFRSPGFQILEKSLK
ncbi:MAG: GNAT family N-acetyltransferase [Candidatus Polarisedimenticolia bacterium]